MLGYLNNHICWQGKRYVEKRATLPEGKHLDYCSIINIKSIMIWNYFLWIIFCIKWSYHMIHMNKEIYRKRWQDVTILCTRQIVPHSQHLMSGFYYSRPAIQYNTIQYNMTFIQSKCYKWCHNSLYPHRDPAIEMNNP